MSTTITLDGVAYVRADTITREPSTRKIVVLQRGWPSIATGCFLTSCSPVVVGLVEEDGDKIVVHDASVVRRWGTTRGLGELAAKGPLPETVLDPAGRVEAHKLAVVLMIDCVEEAWS